ncbi:hypothetical protein EJD97_005594 [Solanum chilense]|uniref:HAT C-terminal dimerisation domain-containing protein n=1 Tax=Solanum chilense TaxID=4083 RepID=A0A6N2AJY2_SOLCI|nr:hypothetical protein EJD97_007922 [Solanum chilense]TMW82585.1 hypothetical protein EJD97_005594 [Solanum chilense]
MFTVYVTVTAAERSFSKFKLTKSSIRSTKSQEMLNELAILPFEKELLNQIVYKIVSNDFASKIGKK